MYLRMSELRIVRLPPHVADERIRRRGKTAVAMRPRVKLL